MYKQCLKSDDQKTISRFTCPEKAVLFSSSFESLNAFELFFKCRLYILYYLMFNFRFTKNTTFSNPSNNFDVVNSSVDIITSNIHPCKYITVLSTHKINQILPKFFSLLYISKLDRFKKTLIPSMNF